MRKGILNGELQNRLDAKHFPVINLDREGSGFFPVYLVEAYGAKGDGEEVTGVAISGTAMTKTGAGWTSAMVGKKVVINPWSPTAMQVRTIAAFVSSNALTLNSSATAGTFRVVIGTDNTTALQACIDAVFAAGGGNIQFRLSMYLFAGALRNPTMENSVLTIPDSVYNGLLIKFSAANEPTNLYNDYDQGPAHATNTTMLYCATVGSGTEPSFISPNVLGAASFTHTSVKFSNLHFRAPVNPSCSMLNFRMGGGLEIDGCTFDVDWDHFHTFLLPTHAGVSAVIFPETNNSDWCMMSRFAVLGWYYGLITGEHVVLREGRVFNNRTGILMEEGQGTALYSVGFNENVHHIDISPDGYVHIFAYGVEFESPLAVGGNNLFNPTHVLYDPALHAIGEIRGLMTIPGHADPLDFTDNFASYHLDVSLHYSVGNIFAWKKAKMTDTFRIGDNNVDSGLQNDALGIKIAHATRDQAISMGGAGSEGMLLSYFRGPKHIYLNGTMVGGNADTDSILVLQQGGARTIIGDVPSGNDDTVTTLQIIGTARVSGETFKLNDVTLEKLSGQGLDITDSNLKVQGTQVLGPRRVGWTLPTGTESRATFATYTAPTISNPPTQAEVQAIADHLQIISRHNFALINDLMTHGMIGA